MNLSALSSPVFRKYAAANFVALNGIWIQRVTMAWLAWHLTGSAQFVGLVAAMNFAPTVFSGPFFGVLADRIDLRRAIMGTQAMTAMMALVLYLIFNAGALNQTVLTLMSLGMGMITSAQTPIRMALAPRLAPKSAVTSVVVLTSMNFNLSRLSGPAIGGMMIAQLGISSALAVMVIAPLPLMIVLIWLQLRPSDTAQTVQQGYGAALREGVAYAARDRQVRQALVLTGISALVGRGILEILPVLADGSFQRGAAGLGQLTAAAGAGALVSGLFQLVAHGGEFGAMQRRALLATLVTAILVIGLGQINLWPFAVLAVAGLGFCGTLVGVSLQSGIQLALPDSHRGRVMSLWALVAMGATAGGAFVQGAIADWLGLSATLTMVGTAGIIAVIALRPRR